MVGKLLFMLFSLNWNVNFGANVLLPRIRSPFRNRRRRKRNLKLRSSDWFGSNFLRARARIGQKCGAVMTFYVFAICG